MTIDSTKLRTLLKTQIFIPSFSFLSTYIVTICTMHTLLQKRPREYIYTLVREREREREKEQFAK